MVIEHGGEHNKPRGRWFFGIRFRLGLFVTLAVSIVLGAAIWALDNAYTDYSKEEIHKRSAALLQSFAGPCAISIAMDDLESLDTYLAELTLAGDEHLGIMRVSMVGYRGQVLADAVAPGSIPESIVPGTGGTLEAFYLEAAIVPQPMWRRYINGDGTPVLMVSMPAVSGLRWGTLIALFDLTEPEEQRRTIRSVVVVVSLVITFAVLGVLIIGLWLIVVRPVRKLARVAAQVREGDLGTRVALSSNDELGHLAGTFDSMASELQEYTAGLEQKVVERTRELYEKNKELENANARLDKLARTDALTGVFNRGHFMETLEQECQRSDRTHNPFSVILGDVDHFKLFNDRYGHQVGDEVLKGVARVLGEGVRGTDVLARYGGEEFVVLLVDTDEEGGMQVANALREAIAKSTFSGPDGEEVGQVTISMGLAVYPHSTDDGAHLLRNADMALYQAKEGGRNQVVLWDSEETNNKE